MRNRRYYHIRVEFRPRSFLIGFHWKRPSTTLLRSPAGARTRPLRAMLNRSARGCAAGQENLYCPEAKAFQSAEGYRVKKLKHIKMLCENCGHAAILQEVPKTCPGCGVKFNEPVVLADELSFDQLLTATGRWLRENPP